MRWAIIALASIAISGPAWGQRIPIRVAPPIPRPMPALAKPVPLVANPVRPVGAPVPFVAYIPFYGRNHRGDDGAGPDDDYDWVVLAIGIFVLALLCAGIVWAVRKWRRPAVGASGACPHCGFAYAFDGALCTHCRGNPPGSPPGDFSSGPRPAEFPLPKPILVLEVDLTGNPLDVVAEVRVTAAHFTREETIQVAVPGEGRTIAVQLKPEMRGKVLCYAHLMSEGAGHLFVRFIVTDESTAIQAEH